MQLTFVNMNVKNFSFAGDFSTLTRFAAITRVDTLALALAITAHRLDLLN
jgi:hypothetical protein